MITLAIVGHTNTGKTSLLRTLLRDDHFGEVANEAATTRFVQEAVIFDNHHSPLITLLDTPGLEDATGVMDFLIDISHERQDGVEKLHAFLKAVETSATPFDFSQEAKVIRAVMGSALALYVIDSRTPPTQKYKDELTLLSYSGVPVVPVFNFTKESTHLDEWQTLLARRNLHLYNRFDTVAFDFDNELALWQNLASVSQHRTPFDKLIHDRQDNWQALLEQGQMMIADFLVDVASFHLKIKDDEDETPTVITMQNTIKTAEQAVIQDLMNLYRFYYLKAEFEPVSATLKNQDPFDVNLLKNYGLKTSVASTAGAVIGAGIDVATLGASLGLGTVVGTILGGGLINAGTIKDKAYGIKRLTVDKSTLLVLANRLLGLHKSLRSTGHAAQLLNTQTTHLSTLPKPLNKAFGENFSSLNHPKNTALMREKLSFLVVEALEGSV